MAGFFPGKPAIHQLMNGGFFGRKPRQSSNYEWQAFSQENPPFIDLWMAGFLAGNPTNHKIMNGRGFFLHENHTFVSLTPIMLLKMLYQIRPVWTSWQLVQDRGLLLVRSLPVAVRSFGQSEYIRTGPGPGLCLQEQKTGPDRTFKH